MGSAGLLLQVFALFASVAAAVVYTLALKDKSEWYLKIGNKIFLAMTGAVVIASVILTTALVVSDFSIEYVARYTDLSLPLLYKLSAFWAGQAGSLLLWLLLLTGFGAIEVIRLKDKPVQYRAAVYLALAVCSAFFALLVSFVQNPFTMLDFMPRDGNGMNPMLQNPGMIIHPPTLYVGYVGFNIIVAHAFASLVTKDLSSMWVKITRGWSIIIWVFLTVGIVIGGWWAYVELGWGGYWAWDPVENASLFPWFTATAFIHSAFIYEHRNKLKAWSFSLILLTFELTILGTFITRSGVIESVHSFGKNSIGTFFLWFIALTTIAYVYYMYVNRKELEDKTEFKYLSREGIFFVANWIFIGVTFVTVFGTFLPWISELVSNQKTTVGASYFNKVTIPFFMAILVASGIAPMIPFGDNKPAEFFKKLIPSAVLMVVAVVICFMLGYTLIVPLLLMAFAAFSFFTIIVRSIEIVRKVGLKAFKTSSRFFAAMIIHLGVVLMAFGITMSSFYNKHVDEIIPQDGMIVMDQYLFKVGKVHTEKGANYISNYVPIEIMENDKLVANAYPEMRIYNNHQEDNFAEVSYYSMLKGDLYFIFSGYDLESNQVRVQAIFQPFIGWIWAGCALMVIGGFYGVINFRRKSEIQTK